MLHKAIVSSFSSHHQLQQQQNWDVNQEMGTGTRQLFQLCQALFICTDSDSFPLLSLPAAEMPLISKTKNNEIFSLASPSQEMQLRRTDRTSSGKRETTRAVGRKSWWQRKNAQEEGQQPQKQRGEQLKAIAHSCDWNLNSGGDSLVSILIFLHTSLYFFEKNPQASSLKELLLNRNLITLSKEGEEIQGKIKLKQKFWWNRCYSMVLKWLYFNVFNPIHHISWQKCV